MSVNGHTPYTIRMIKFGSSSPDSPHTTPETTRTLSSQGEEEQDLLDRVNSFITLHENNGFTLVGLHPIVVETRIVQYVLLYRLANPSGLALLDAFWSEA